MTGLMHGCCYTYFLNVALCLDCVNKWACDGQAFEKVSEAKHAEKEIMDKYLALFKQHTTADERLVCCLVSLSYLDVLIYLCRYIYPSSVIRL